MENATRSCQVCFEHTPSLSTPFISLLTNSRSVFTFGGRCLSEASHYVQFTGRYVAMLRRNGQTISRYEYFTDLYVQKFNQKNVCSNFSVPFFVFYSKQFLKQSDKVPQPVV